ncbi:hypothetical protein [Novilysobacter erysipheiresistens]|uniref:Uncharacterized protein n=1 Tax=Novilysobacter erysipheiresistens TaxID=1749332 RepID=A0ABU7Z034_9GAMM
MNGSPAAQRERDRPFDCSKIPLGEAAACLVGEFLHIAGEMESRQRARRAEDLRRHEAMASALVLDLAHRTLSQPDGWVTVSLQNDDYSPARRQAPFLTQRFVDLLNLLASDPEILEMRRGIARRGGGGERTTVRAGARLLRVFAVADIALTDIGRDRSILKNSLVLMGPKLRGSAEVLPIPDTAETRLLRVEVQAINEFLAQADLDWLGDVVDDKIDLSDRFVFRVFNNGSFKDGGRLFGGFWHCKDKLEGVCFGQHRAVALDYGQMGVRAAYVQAGLVPPEGDLYSVPGLQPYRKGVKTVLSALLAADKIPTAFPKGVRKDGLFPSSWKFARVLEPIAEFHSPIRHLFGTKLCFRLMYEESCLLIKVLLRLKDLGVVALPLHDGILVSNEHLSIGESTMRIKYHEHFGVDGVVDVSYPITSYNL